MDLPDDEVSTGSPKRGRPARINRQMIVDAARSLDREGLTLLAVADRLGVDRKALSYHVAGRQELIDLVATQTIGEELQGLELPQAWDAAIRSWAEATWRAMLREGSMALVIDHLPGAGILTSIDALLQRLLDAGFDEITAGRAIYCLTGIVFAGARDTLLVERRGEHPTMAEVAHILQDLPDDELPHLRRVPLAGDPLRGAEDQARFDIDLVVAGLHHQLIDRAP